MFRFNLIQAWRARLGRREDPALQRFSKLQGIRGETPVTAIPVFMFRKAA